MANKTTELTHTTIYSPLEQEILEDYLTEVKKSSKGTWYNYRSQIINSLNYINRPLQEITKSDMKSYFTFYDGKDITLKAKNRTRGILKVFFEFVEALFEENGIDFRNPVPSSRIFKFSTTEKDFKEEKDAKYSIEEIYGIIDKAKKRSFKHFIILGILAETGMRAGECLSIKIENIDFSKNLITTGMVKNNRKSKKLLKFFITPRFANYLKLYIAQINRNAGYLFNTRGNNYYAYCNFASWMERNFGMDYTQFHKFRRSIITHRVKMGCPEWISEGLTNHKQTSTQKKYYIKLNDQEKYELYQKWFPYRECPYF